MYISRTKFHQPRMPFTEFWLQGGQDGHGHSNHSLGREPSNSMVGFAEISVYLFSIVFFLGASPQTPWVGFADFGQSKVISNYFFVNGCTLSGLKLRHSINGHEETN
jgi:hypothetical protein